MANNAKSLRGQLGLRSSGKSKKNLTHFTLYKFYIIKDFLKTYTTNTTLIRNKSTIYTGKYIFILPGRKNIKESVFRIVFVYCSPGSHIK